MAEQKVTLTLEVPVSKAMQILQLLGASPAVVVNNSVNDTPVVGNCEEEAIAALNEEVVEEEEAAEEVVEEEAAEEEEEQTPPADDVPEDEPDNSVEETEAEEDEGGAAEEPDEEPEEEEEVAGDVEYTIDDVRAAVQDYMKTFKTAATGKTELGKILAGLPTPSVNLSGVNPKEYGLLISQLQGEDDPTA